MSSERVEFRVGKRQTEVVLHAPSGNGRNIVKRYATVRVGEDGKPSPEDLERAIAELRASLRTQLGPRGG